MVGVAVGAFLGVRGPRFRGAFALGVVGGGGVATILEVVVVIVVGGACTTGGGAWIGI